jgi:hypothetical protein
MCGCESVFHRTHSGLSQPACPRGCQKRKIYMNNDYALYKIASAHQDKISRDADNFRKFREAGPNDTPNVLRIISMSPVLVLLIFVLIKFL